MRTSRLNAQIWLPHDRATIFSFFADPRNLEGLTPDWLHFEILTPLPTEMRVGLHINYRLRLRGFRLHWQSEISAWEPPQRFVDRQTRGPYRVWIHEHTFSERNGGTIVGDAVEYAAPGGPVIDKLFVARDLKQIFAYRHDRLRQMFGSSGTGAQLTDNLV